MRGEEAEQTAVKQRLWDNPRAFLLAGRKEQPQTHPSTSEHLHSQAVLDFLAHPKAKRRIKQYKFGKPGRGEHGEKEHCLISRGQGTSSREMLGQNFGQSEGTQPEPPAQILFAHTATRTGVEVSLDKASV